ncbi:Creatinine amidohydrolase [Planctomycetes bacterium Pla163]|uniref:Creatinine amidohydrolase n=1 Tax=Rohdeia mirabilis TaxID=2528008 RepID=A0A518CY93_9BACT|nr:Creatinine amidohydrolase [Planctomycetes bacterium Pla163]
MSGAQPLARHRLVDLTWPEARELFAADPICLLPTGATEPHGPHLPLDVDVVISSAQAEAAARRLVAAGVPALVLPPLSYGVTFFTEGFEGRVSLRPGTLWSMIDDIVKSLEEQGVRRICMTNAHLEPEQVKVLRGVVLDHGAITKNKAHLILADQLRRRWTSTLGAEFATGECHAGDYETSIVLATDPDRVRTDVMAALPGREVGLVAGIQSGVKSFRELGADQAYCGEPAAASAEKGREILEQLAEITVVTCREAWPERFQGSV